MLSEVKEKLLDEPQYIVDILSHFGYANITLKHNEIRCGFEEGSNPSAIVVRIKDNPNLFVKDYSRNMSYDLPNYLMKSRGVGFKEVINVIKQTLGIDNLYTYKKKVGLFNGIYDSVAKKSGTTDVKTYPEGVLDQYQRVPCERFLRDGISIEAQSRWGIGYDIESQRITIPIRLPTGELMGIKARANFELDEFTPKYCYLGLDENKAEVNCPMSQTLFGFYENYDSLYENDLLIFESEKSILKLDTWGYNNAVALGSNSLSSTQTKLVLSLNPRRVIFMLDKGLSLENTKRNADLLKTFCVMRQLEVEFWDWTENITLADKDAPCDDTLEEFKYILKNEIKNIEELEEKEVGEL